nr:ribonuclease H-like domain-containing protein [Tanacetum cinerariifolium]
MTDYSLWEVIKNGNKVSKKTVGTSEETYEPTSAKEKLGIRNEIKARGTLLMAFLNKDQLKFHSYQDAKLLMEAIEKRYGGNKESKKVYRTLLNTSSTNEADTTASRVSTAHTQSATINSTSVDNLSDTVICAFLASQPNSPLLTKEDLKQIDLDDLEEMDLHWEMDMLTIRAKRFMKRTDMNLATWQENAELYRIKTTKSYQAEEEIPTNYAFMELTSLGSSLSSESKDVRPIRNNSNGVNNKNFANKLTHLYPKRGFVPQAVLTRSGKINTAGTNVNTATIPVNIAGSKSTVNHPRLKSKAYKRGHSHDTRLNNKFLANKNSIFNKKVNTVRVNDSTARDKAVVSGNMKRDVNAIKASACWGNPQQKEYKEKGVVDNGCSRHITRNNCYLTDFEAYDGGFISFRDGKGRIFGKERYIVARTPQQNEVAERKNKTLIEAARTMLVDSKLLITFWTEVVNTACYVINTALVTKPHNKTPYELIRGRPPLIDFMKAFGCPITILNTSDNLGKFEGKADEGYFVGALVTKPRNKTPYELIHGIPPLIDFMKPFGCPVTILSTSDNLGKFEGKADKGYFVGYSVLFDIDSLTISINYVPVVAGNQTNGIVGSKENLVAGQDDKKKELEQEYILIPICTTNPLISQVDAGTHSTNISGSGNLNPTVSSSNPPADQIETLTVESPIPTVNSPVPTACLNDSPEPSSEARIISKRVANQEESPSLDNILSLTN